MKDILHIIVLLTLLIFSSCDRNCNECAMQFNQSLFLKEKTIPIITFKLDNDKINLILDTGSEVNILNEDYYKSHSEHFILIDSVNNSINTVSTIYVFCNITPLTVLIGLFTESIKMKCSLCDL